MAKSKTLNVSLYRKATKSELAKMGASAGAERYVPKSVKRVGAKTKWISKRAYQTAQTGVSLEKRAAQISAGERISGHVERAVSLKDK